jgi:hypothetical protein
LLILRYGFLPLFVIAYLVMSFFSLSYDLRIPESGRREDCPPGSHIT